MKVSELGEAGLISLLAEMVNSARDERAVSWQRLVLGIGDDTAAWRGGSSLQLATVDALRQGVHFTLETTGWWELGWKALAVNLSDIAAMGGLPRYALVTLALPEQTEVEDVRALYRGALSLAEKFGVAIIGGDVDRAPLVEIAVTVIGETEDRNQPLLTRSAARIGDRVAVTGYLGGAAGGLEMMARGLQFNQEAMSRLRRAFNHPHPRIAEGQVLVEKGVRAAIDVSDGLIADMRHICQASHVGARIERERVPVDPVVKANFGDRALDMALGGGEDYELLFTASEEIIERVRADVSCPVTVIGEIVADREAQVRLIDSRGRPVSPGRAGWEHFKTE